MSGNVYQNHLLGFHIEKPENWDFLPAPWASSIISKTSEANPSLRDLLEQAKKPFVYIQKSDSPKQAAIPAVKVSCLSIRKPDKAKRESLLQTQIETLSRFDSFNLINSSASCIVAGCPAFEVEFEYILKNREGEQYLCCSTLWTLFAKDFAFAVGLSGPPQHKDSFFNDQQKMLSSIKIESR